MSPNELRGRTSALYVFTLNLMGLGLGPLIVGFFTEYVFADRQLVGWSVATTVAIAASISVFCLLTGRAAFRQTVNSLDNSFLN